MGFVDKFHDYKTFQQHERESDRRQHSLLEGSTVAARPLGRYVVTLYVLNPFRICLELQTPMLSVFVLHVI